MRNRSLVILILVFSWSGICYGQLEDYQYIRPLTGATGTWNRIVIPIDVFGKIKPDFSDVRILGITQGRDTIEAPYFLNVDAGKSEFRTVPFEMINRVKNREGYFFTLGLDEENTINRVEMDFSQSNFDWKITLEGSQDMKEWFTVTEDYRILSIRNEHTDYHFTTVTFPPARFPFFRIMIPAVKDPDLGEVRVTEHEIREGTFMTGIIDRLKIEQNRELRQTIIRADLKQVIPVSYLKLNVKDGFDYYRPVSINSITDSVETPKGWQYNFRLLASGTLSSFEKPEFQFPGVFTGKLYVVIDNFDNAPLRIDSVIIKANVHELITRFNEPADYFLAYGNANARSPYYDIENFRDRVPENLTLVSLSDEQHTGESVRTRSYSFFENKIFLWAIMIIIIIVLGWFSMRMIGKKT